MWKSNWANPSTSESCITPSCLISFWLIFGRGMLSPAPFEAMGAISSIEAIGAKPNSQVENPKSAGSRWKSAAALFFVNETWTWGTGHVTWMKYIHTYIYIHDIHIWSSYTSEKVVESKSPKQKSQYALSWFCCRAIHILIPVHSHNISAWFCSAVWASKKLSVCSYRKLDSPAKNCTTPELT